MLITSSIGGLGSRRRQERHEKSDAGTDPFTVLDALTTFVNIPKLPSVHLQLGISLARYKYKGSLIEVCSPVASYL